MRVAILDIGSNSIRLYVADVPPRGEPTVILRESRVSRLAEAVDSSGLLAPAAIARTFAVLDDYRERIAELRCERKRAVMTSAVRDAANGRRFAAQVRELLSIDASILSGEEEARLTFGGAMACFQAAGQPGASERTGAAPVAVIDIGGGSTEIVIGQSAQVEFHTSLQAGVVRMSERHLRSDPATPTELEQLAADCRETLQAGIPAPWRAAVRSGIAVAGTATSAAAIAQELDPYDPARVHGFNLELRTVEGLFRDLASMSEAQRRAVRGLHPDRAATIVAGMALLGTALELFDLASVRVSEQDLLVGAALQLAERD